MCIQLILSCDGELNDAKKNALLLCFLLLQKKKSALFEVAEVVPVMTNNYEENILRGVRDSSYSLESSIDLLQKDVVQLHAPRYQSMRRVSLWTIHGEQVWTDILSYICFSSYLLRMWLAAHRRWISSFGHAMILKRLSVCCSPDGRGLMMNPLGLFRFVALTMSCFKCCGACCSFNCNVTDFAYFVHILTSLDVTH